MNGKQAYALSRTYTESKLEDVSDAYDVAVELGFQGTKEEWLASLKGGEPVIFEQATPSVEWRITHSLNEKYPEVACFDTDGDMIHGDINYFSVNMLIITFCKPVSGKAYIR